MGDIGDDVASPSFTAAEVNQRKQQWAQWRSRQAGQQYDDDRDKYLNWSVDARWNVKDSGDIGDDVASPSFTAAEVIRGGSSSGPNGAAVMLGSNATMIVTTAVGNLGHRHVDAGRCQALAVPGERTTVNRSYKPLQKQRQPPSNMNQYASGRKSDKLNMEDLVEKMTTFLTVTTMDIFYVDCLKEKHSSHTSDREELRKRKLRRASAWYMVTYESSTENSFFSFPWSITEDKVWCTNILCWKITQFVENSDLEEDDGLVARCDTFKTAFGIIEEWLVKETLLGKRQPGAASMPGLCYNGLLVIYSEFLRSRKLHLRARLVARKRHIMVSATPEAKDETAHEPVTEALNNLCKAPSDAWQIVDGVVEPHYFDDSEDENDSPDMADQGGRGNSHEQDLQVFPLHQPPDAHKLETDLGEDTSVGTLVVSFLRWHLEQHRLPREACHVSACAGGGYDCQTHRLPMVALQACSSLAVSLDPCHISLPCDPAYHEPH
ncbi:hypothetical protein HPB50_028989 [Hyalomma asiaticum]|nr:hypothetical protein HPB50_028989 [Hyalomma asiaticum]